MSNAPKLEHFAIDLDGTLLEYSGWKGETHYGQPIPGAIDWVKAVLAKGHKVTVFTTRVDQLAVASHLVSVGFPHLPVTNVKLSIFSVFIDDRAVTFYGPSFWTDQIQAEPFVPWWKQPKEREPTALDELLARIADGNRVQDNVPLALLRRLHALVEAVANTSPGLRDGSVDHALNELSKPCP